MSARALAESLSTAELCDRLDKVDQLHSSKLVDLMLDCQSAIETNLAGAETRLLVALARMTLHSRDDEQLRRSLFP